jgi:hypothetical protein
MICAILYSLALGWLIVACLTTIAAWQVKTRRENDVNYTDADW